MEHWIVGGTLALVGVAYIFWDIRNGLKPRRSSSEGGSDGERSGVSDGGSGGDGD